MSSDWIFLSKKGQDEYINMFAQGSGGTLTDTEDFVYSDSNRPIVLRSILKYKIMEQCKHDGRQFYYMDTGYFGNKLWKVYHRIVPNDLQHNDIIQRSSDRWQQLNLQLHKRKYGSKIIVAAPGEKPCRVYGIDQQQWIRDTVAEIKKYTDRPVELRQKNLNRADRVRNDPFVQALNDNVHAVVTFNSIAGVESVMHGVPTFVCAPSHAALPVANTDLKNIDDPYWPDEDKRHAWVHHLAYGQFHIDEMKNGTAYRILNAH